MCSDCTGGVACGDEGDDLDELRAHLVDDGTISEGVVAAMAEQWIFPGARSEGRRGTVRVTRKARTGFLMNYDTNTLDTVTYYHATWRGDEGGVEKFIVTPEALDKMRALSAAAAEQEA